MSNIPKIAFYSFRNAILIFEKLALVFLKIACNIKPNKYEFN